METSFLIHRLVRTVLVVFVGCAMAQDTSGVRLHLEVAMGGLTSAAFSPDGRQVLVGSKDRTVRLWDVATGREIQRLEGHLTGVSAVAFSPEGSRAVSTGDQTARVWDLATGKQIQVIGELDDIVQGRAKRRPQPEWPFIQRTQSVAFSPDGKGIVWSHAMIWAELLQLAAPEQTRLFAPAAQNEQGPFQIMSFSRDRTQFLAAGGHSVRFWNLGPNAAGIQTESRSLAVDFEAWAAAISPDGKSALVGSEDGFVELYDIDSGVRLRRIAAHTEATGYGRQVWSLAFSSDTRFALSGSRDKTARLWDLQDGREVLNLTGHDDTITTVAFSPADDVILTASGDGTARLWDRNSGVEIRRLEGRTRSIHALAITPDRQHVVVGSSAKSIHRIDLASGQVQDSEPGNAPVGSLAISPDGLRVLTGDIFDLQTGKLLHRLEGNDEPVIAARISRDGRIALTATPAATRSWSFADATLTNQFSFAGYQGEKESGAFRKASALSPDGRLFVTDSIPGEARAAFARILSLETGRLVQACLERSTFGNYDRLEDAQFNAAGDKVFLAFTGTTSGIGGANMASFISVCDVATGKELRRFGNHVEPINALVLSPDERYILTGSGPGLHEYSFNDSINNSVTIWDALTGREIRKFDGHTAAVTAVAFLGDGLIVTGSLDNTVRFWERTSGRELAKVVFLSDGGWAVVSPEGHFDASDPNRMDGIHWVRGNEVILPRDLNTQRFYVPELLSVVTCPYLRTGCRPLPPVNNLQNPLPAPAVEVPAPPAGSTRTRVRIQNRGGGIGEIRVRVNGRELSDAVRGDRPAASATSAELAVDLAGATLEADGRNAIEVSVYNAENSIRSRGFKVAWETPQESERLPQLWAIIAGSARYADPAMRLAYASKDATDFSTAITLASERLVGKENTHVSTFTTGEGLPPNKANLEAAFAEVANRAGPDDTVVVYFAGHAVAWNATYYYLTPEARGTDVGADEGLRNNATVSSNDLAQWLTRKGIPKKVVVILDTCAAGAAASDLAKIVVDRNLSADHKRALQLLREVDDSYYFLMGSAADRVSYEAGRYGQGLLTYALLLGIRGGALETDGRVDVARLFEFARGRVPELARGLGGIQKPEIRSPKGGSFPIGRLEDSDRLLIPLASPKPVLIQVLCSDEDQIDPLGLRSRLRAELRAAGYPNEDVTVKTEPPIVYLDGVTDEFLDSLSPRVQYRVENGQVRARVRLIRAEQSIAEAWVEAPVSAPDLPGRVAQEIIQLSERVKK